MNKPQDNEATASRSFDQSHFMSLSPQASVNQPKVTSYAKTSKFAPDVKNSTTIRNVNQALDDLKINELNTPRIKSIQTQQA